ncbi:EAL domain-containing protein [Dactylosporangium vinaceum]|uniref:Bifunctional diguanylate cyclase/phosphodiesterase n=1 Tax=Dactylosporangium vinaceum TaxID=53362 RepID=A0ABV5M138_9ACTN|nr:GGDEF domain-containing phosphodiesterase [Dactylosporangium vinaceum]UAB97233.1 EAL domain-containing protein [Dactylosporangium vinaceum]
MRDVVAAALSRGALEGRSTAVLLVGLEPAAGAPSDGDFSERMRRSVLRDDPVGRFGDEYAAVLCDIRSVDNAEAVARRIAVAGPARIGIAVAAPGEYEADDLLRRAALALEEARSRTDGAPWACYEPSMTGGSPLEQELREAIRKSQLRLLYQPIVALPDGDLAGVEALVRWAHPGRGTLDPDAFIPLAERIGVIGDLGRWVLREASAQAARWQRRLPALQLNVNVSPRQLDEDGFAAQVLAILDDTGFFPGNLVLEVTEGAVIGERASVAQLAVLSNAGIRIALDDFGTGYSSLRYLARLPVDVLKLDRLFVAELDGTSRGGAVAQAVLRLGQILHLDTVAEGVESEAQARELTILGCHKAQGFHYAHPLTPADLQRWLPAGDLSRYEAEIWGPEV